MFLANQTALTTYLKAFLPWVQVTSMFFLGWFTHKVKYQRKCVNLILWPFLEFLLLWVIVYYHRLGI